MNTLPYRIGTLGSSIQGTNPFCKESLRGQPKKYIGKIKIKTFTAAIITTTEEVPKR